MQVNHEKIAYVVPTMDRPDDLRTLLQSLTAETRLADQIIIVDASDPPIKNVCDEFPSLPLDYIRVFPPSLAAQRNAGMAKLRPEITIAGYLDDDIKMEPDATECMIVFWENAPADVGGASFSIINQPHYGKSALARFFLMDGPRHGQVLASGFPVQIPFVEKTIETQWLYGGATVWRRNVIEQFSYDEWYLGHGFLEDLDYSYRVNQKHSLHVIGDARVWHFSRPIAEGKHYALGLQQVVNRLYFTSKVGEFSKIKIYWALFGQVLQNLYGAIIRADKNSWQRTKGNLTGFVAVLGGRDKSFEGHWK